MAYSEFNASYQGMDGAMCYMSEISLIFAPMLLFVFFFVILLGNFFSQKRTTGRGNFFHSFGVAGFVTMVVAIVMKVGIPCMIGTNTLVTCIVVGIIGAILILTSGD